MLHEFENNQDTESFLKQNGERLSNQCVQVMRHLYANLGKRYTAKMINDELNIADGGRRLRDLFAFRNDIKREWIKNEDGSCTKGKEYWLEIPKPPTKKELTMFYQPNLF